VVYQYDAANRLIAASGYKPSTFAYDGDGNRITQSVGNGTYSYINDVATPLPVVIQESGPDGPIAYEYGLGLIEAFSPEFNFFYHYDGLGSVIALTNAAGKPVAAYAYDPWGNSLLDIPDNVGTKNKFRFTGEAIDPGTNLYYLRARYYDPDTGRFLSRDPLHGAPAIPLLLNRYIYTLNNPIRFRDPSGLTAQDTSNMQQFTPSLVFSLPNTVLNPQFTSFGKPVICTGTADCVSDALTLVSSVITNKGLDIASFMVSAYKDAADPALNSPSKILSLGVDAGLLVLAVYGGSEGAFAGTLIGLELYLLDRASTAPDVIPITTPSVAVPIVIPKLP